MPLFDNLRTQLKTYRKAKRLSQADIADALDSDQSMISGFERGIRNLGSDKIDRLMDLMGLRLIEGEPASPTHAAPILREGAAPYGRRSTDRPTREVPIPSAEQIEIALEAAQRLGDEETTKAIQELQMNILGRVQELNHIGEAFASQLKVIEQQKQESQHRPKDADGK